MLAAQNYCFDDGARASIGQHIAVRGTQPHLANARSVRNALDHARLRQANRLFNEATRPIYADRLSLISDPDIRASRVFRGGLDAGRIIGDRLDGRDANRQSAAE